jgi:hypothetical protein
MTDEKDLIKTLQRDTDVELVPVYED